MKATSSMVFAAALVLSSVSLGAAISSGQQRMPAASAPRAAMARPRPAATHVVARAGSSRRAAPVAATQTSGVHFNTSTNSFEFADGSPATLQDLLNPVPGLGFDYHHLSVMNQDLAIKALIDPATEMKLA